MGRRTEIGVSDQTTDVTGVRGILERLLKYVALIGGLVLLVIMLLVSVAVFFRYALNQPILGVQEYVQIGMSLVVMMAMPFATITGAHIRVDVLDHKLGAWGRYIGDLLARGLGIYILYLLIMKTWDKALDANKYGDVTNMMEIPVWIAYGAITIGFGCTILVMLLQLLIQIRGEVQGYE